MLFVAIAVATIPAIVFALRVADRVSEPLPAEAAAAPRARPATSAAPKARPTARAVHASELGAEWPLTVMSGSIECVTHPKAPERDLLAFTTGQERYALNGYAETAGARDISPIWRDAPDGSGGKVSIRPLIDIALTLCPRR